MFEKTIYPQVLIFGKYNEQLVEKITKEKVSQVAIYDYAISDIDMVLNHVIHEQIKHKHFKWVIIHRFLSSLYQSQVLNQILTNGRFCRLGIILVMEEIFQLPLFVKHNISHFYIPKDIGYLDLYDIWTCYFTEMKFLDLLNIVQNAKSEYIVCDMTRHELYFADNFI